ncbi:MAG: AraC family transcriptional regulator [Bacteroidetes bacterium]|nr:MAG: AraC family transcriptional regulator [Bacteroidota bacterium]
MMSSVKTDLEEMNRIGSAKMTTRRELYARLCLTRKYILRHFQSPIQLDELSKVAFLSKYHLLRTYKSVFGITPYQEVIKLRLARAKDLMRTGEKSLEEIAFEVGFSDRRSFTKAFKKETGQPPSCFRGGSLKVTKQCAGAAKVRLSPAPISND